VEESSIPAAANLEVAFNMSNVAERAAAFPHLYSPLVLRGQVLRNRIVSTPHAAGGVVTV
jgi:uncharacterized protein (DUF952 family)